MGIRNLSPELAKKAKDELFEDPERIPQDLQNIKDWLATQPHIKARTDDQWLISFLRVCKYNLEMTKEKLDLFYTMKTFAPEFAEALDPMDERVQHVLKTGAIIPLSKTEKPDDPRIMLMRPGVMDHKKVSMIEYMRILTMTIYLQMMEDDNTIVAGQIGIMDMANINKEFFIYITPVNVKKVFLTRQDAFPLRQKSGHHINTPKTLMKMFDILGTFMSDKNKARMHFHDDPSELHKFVSKSILPVEFGGEGGSMEDIIDEWKTKFENHREWFLEDAIYKTDESKRPGGPKTAEILFGIEESFGNLDID